jgi:hypothetical protein
LIAAAQPAKTTLFAGGNGADIRKSAAGDFFQSTWERVGIALIAAAQLAKTTLFAGGNGADIRKSAAGDFFQST